MQNERYLAEFDRRNPFPYENGCRIVSASPAGARASLAIEHARHHNAVGVVHGGVYLMLADNVAAAAANADGRLRLSACGSYEMLAGAREGTLHAEAVLLHETNRLAYHDVTIRDDAGALLFHAVMQSFRVEKKE